MKKFCSKPFEWLEIGPKGNAFVCCPGWLPKTIGNINEQSIDDIWNSESAREVRSSILDGSFKYCNDNCPYLKTSTETVCEIDDVRNKSHLEIINNNKTEIEKPKWLNLAYDLSCNLKCPSCRCELIQITSGKEYSKLKSLQEKILYPLINHIEWLYITGSGDPFGSKLFRELLLSLETKNHPNLKIYIHTNGVLLTETMWEKLHNIQKSIKQIQVSIDAATESTYNINRVGGNWNKLMENLRFISSLKKNNRIDKFEISFVVQRNNWREILKFIEIGFNLSVDQIKFYPIDDWGRGFLGETFEERNIISNKHPEFPEFKKYLLDNKKQLQNKKINLGKINEIFRDIKVI